MIVFSYLLGIGKDIAEDYLGDIIDYGKVKIQNLFGSLINKIEYTNVIEKVVEILNNIVRDYKNAIENYNYENAEKDIFHNFDKREKVNKLLEEIFQEECELKDGIIVKRNIIEQEIKNHKNEFNKLNILLKGDENMINKILDALFIKQNEQKEYLINVKLKGIEKLKKVLLTQNKKSEIDCVWQFVDQNQNIDINDYTSNDLVDSEGNILPIIYILFKDKIEAGKIKTFRDSKISFEKPNYKVLKQIFRYYIIDFNQLDKEKIDTKNKIDEEDSEKPFISLLKKTVLNILIHSREIKTKKTYEKMDSMVSQINFSFGNEISNLVIMNKQINNIIFKAFLFPNNKVPCYVKKKNKKLLESFQTQLEYYKNSYFTDAANKGQITSIYSEKIKKFKSEKEKAKDPKEKNKFDFLINIYDKTIELINNINIFKNDSDKKKNKDRRVHIQSINEIIRTMLDDDYLKKSSICINKLIIESLKDEIIYNYNKIVIKDYYFQHKNEFVFLENNTEENTKEKSEKNS